MRVVQWIGMMVACALVSGCASKIGSITPMEIEASRASDERACLVAGVRLWPVRVVQDPERAVLDPRYRSWPRDAVVFEQRTVYGGWQPVQWFEARDGLVRWFPVDVDDDGTDEIALFRTVGRGNAGAVFVTVLRLRSGVWYEALEVRTERPVSLASPPSPDHPPYGYLDRDVSFGRDRHGRTVMIVRTTADIPEGTSLLDATQIAEVARGVTVYRFDPASGGFALVED